MILVLRKKKKHTGSSRVGQKKNSSSRISKSVRKDDSFSVTDLEALAKKIEQEPALIRIGKNGFSESILTELIKLIRLKKAVKVKILSNAPIEDSKEFFDNLESNIGFKLWRKKGNTAIFIFKSVK